MYSFTVDVHTERPVLHTDNMFHIHDYSLKRAKIFWHVRAHKRFLSMQYFCCCRLEQFKTASVVCSKVYDCWFRDPPNAGSSLTESISL